MCRWPGCLRGCLVYQATLYFCDRFIDKRSRTTDQMVQAARSGKQIVAKLCQLLDCFEKLSGLCLSIACAADGWRRNPSGKGGQHRIELRAQRTTLRL